MNTRSALVLFALYGTLFSLFGQVQINPPFSMPDVNIIQVGDRAYAFCGTDMDPFDFEAKRFIMPYWRCFSSTDLIHWEFESMLNPAEMYMGESDKCFAGHGVYKNDKWYWYFSNYIKNTGVATADSPKGPWKDAIGKPLIPDDLTKTHEYDGCVFTDDDGQSYIIFGSWFEKKICYHIAALNDDMISLKEDPIQIPVEGIPEGHDYIAVDAPFMHKANGLYYLSWRRPYAVSENIYGPYHFIGLQDAKGHGGFFTFNNQDFVNFTSLKEGYRLRYRFCALAYVNYNADGSIAPMEDLIRQYGVGQYDANWPAIQAEWFMAMPNGPRKMPANNGFVVANLQNGHYLKFPNIHNCAANAKVEVTYSSACKHSGSLIVKAFDVNGPELGRTTFQPTDSWDTFQTLVVDLANTPPGSLSICFVVVGDAKEELIRIDEFKMLK